MLLKNEKCTHLFAWMVKCVFMLSYKDGQISGYCHYSCILRVTDARFYEIIER